MSFADVRLGKNSTLFFSKPFNDLIHSKIKIIVLVTAFAFSKLAEEEGEALIGERNYRQASLFFSLAGPKNALGGPWSCSFFDWKGNLNYLSEADYLNYEK